MKRHWRVLIVLVALSGAAVIPLAGVLPVCDGDGACGDYIGHSYTGTLDPVSLTCSGAPTDCSTFSPVIR